MTDQNDENTVAGDAAEEARNSAKESRLRRAHGKVTDYADLNPAIPEEKKIRDEMETLMLPLERAPDDFEAIINYGNPPLKKLGDVATDMMKIEASFNKQVNVMGEAMAKLQNGVNGMNLQEMTKQLRSAVLKNAQSGGKGLLGIAKGVKGIGGSLIGKTGPKKSEEDQFIEDMQAALPEMLIEMMNLVKDLENADTGIKQVMNEAYKLGAARMEATRDLSTYLGASKEVLRRYNEEWIPEAKENFEESQDPDDKNIWEDTAKRRDDFMDRIAILEGSRGQSVLAGQQLRQMIETMEDQRKKIQDIIHNSQNEWKAMFAAAGIAGSSLKVAQMLKKADEFGDKVFETNMQMIETAHQMTLNSKARGSVDPAKLLEGLQRMQLMLDKEEDARKSRLLQLDATATALRGATDKLIEAADSTNKARLLEASEQAKKGEQLDAGNDNDKLAAQRKPRAPRQP